MNGYDDQVRQNSYIKRECEKTNCDSNVTIYLYCLPVKSIYKSNQPHWIVWLPSCLSLSLMSLNKKALFVLIRWSPCISWL